MIDLVTCSHHQIGFVEAQRTFGTLGTEKTVKNTNSKHRKPLMAIGYKSDQMLTNDRDGLRPCINLSTKITLQIEMLIVIVVDQHKSINLCLCRMLQETNERIKEQRTENTIQWRLLFLFVRPEQCLDGCSMDRLINRVCHHRWLNKQPEKKV